jgi:hypothetical protein
LGKWVSLWDSQTSELLGSDWPSVYRQEEKYQQKAAESKEVKLCGQYPPIEKMDASLSTLVNCE